MGPEPSTRLFLLHFVKSELEAGRCHPRDDYTGSRPSMRVSEYRDPVQLHELHAGQQAELGGPTPVPSLNWVLSIYTSDAPER